MREVIAEHGGLATVSGLARLWGVSRQRVHDMTRREGFPRPIHVEGSTQVVFSIAEATAYRETYRPPGRPKGTSDA